MILKPKTKGSYGRWFNPPDDLKVNPTVFKDKKGKSRKKRKRNAQRKKFVQTKEFLSSWEWCGLRYKVLKKYGRRCMCCGATPDDGVKINVDHIKSRHHYPELALTESNLQVLCEYCNKGKGANDSTDWRPKNKST